MVLDQHQIRALADEGGTWNDFAARLVTRGPRRLAKALLMITAPARHRLRRVPLLTLPGLVSAAFVGIAVLPAALAIGLSA